MSLDYRKTFVNKEDIYPISIPDMVNEVRKIHETKRKQTLKPPGRVKERNKEKHTSASSISTKEKSGEKKD